jgi:2-amino-4-hydroxy-6-hydroxymethyldihydropteridine diphosphokinase
MQAWIGIGANLGDARANVLDAIERLARTPGITPVRASSLYRTAPIDSSGDDYVNAVMCIDTTLAPHDLLAALHGIERAHGRERPYRNAPRTLDLDLLLYGDNEGGARIDDATLTVPHPRLHERAFVLVPLAELARDLAPELVIPGRGPLAVLLLGVAGQAIERLHCS